MPGDARRSELPRLVRVQLTGPRYPRSGSGGWIWGLRDAPKSNYGRRAIPLSESVSRALWRLRCTAPGQTLVFTTGAGKMVDASNLMSRVLKPAAVEAGLGEWVHAKGRRRAETWVGFHTFRHTCATILFRNGLNAKQVQMWLGPLASVHALDVCSPAAGRPARSWLPRSPHE
jgi:integrase